MAMMLITLLLLCAIGLVQSVPLQDQTSIQNADKCGYESCTEAKEGFLNVHIVPHTHDDVGWLKTVDQYYYGSRNNIQKAGVQYILDSVIKELWEDPKRRFIYVETAFFWKWWVKQSEATQNKVHTLVREGRFQFVGGAWSMNDEAASHYQSTIDQFTWGLSKLNQTFGKCGLPRVGWQIDPFGHSREFASLLARMGYDGLFLGRIDYQDKQARKSNKNMEMLWRGDDALGKSSDIFTGILYNTYSPPPGFCFDVLCNDEPIIDDSHSPMYNVESKVATFLDISLNMSNAYRTNNILVTMGEDFNYQDAAMWFKNLDKLIDPFQYYDVYFSLQISEFLDYVRKQANCYRTDNVIMTMGGDFTYQDAAMWYNNLDKLIKYSNLKSAKDGTNISLFYSTPTCYLKAVKEANPILPTKQDDFFPYASDPTAYWTGYFTSRPTTKYFEREANNILQMVKQLQVLAHLEEHNEFVLDELKSAMGIMQHHDAITGTEKQHVTHDYERILSQAVDDALIIARQAVNQMSQSSKTKPQILGVHTCRLNESSCHVSENSERFVVTIYNPLAWQVKTPVLIPVLDATYDVFDPNGNTVQHQLYELPNAVKLIPTRKSKATHEITFICDLKPLSYKSFYVIKHARTKRDINGERKYEYYNNINEYWNDIKDKTVIDIKNIEGRTVNKENPIPIEPTPHKPTEYKKFNIEVLKDTKNDNLDDIEDFLKDDERKTNRENRRIGKVSFPELSVDEMRMLSDDPMVVERFDDEVVVFNRGGGRYQRNTRNNEIKIALSDGTNVSFNISMYYYTGTAGKNEKPSDRASGAYIFRPNEVHPKKLEETSRDEVKGPIFEEYQVYLPNAYYAFRLYNDLKTTNIDWIVGPIPIDDDIGKEYIIRYETDILNNGEFYTDSNGRQMLRRKLNYRPQWNVTLEEPVAGNYYPVTNEIYVKNDARKAKAVIITDRSQGGTSLIEGNIELMLHRRLLHDDAFGVGEPLNETAFDKGLVVRGKHAILISNTDNIDTRKYVLQMQLPPIAMFSNAANLNYDDWKKLKNEYSWAVGDIPDGLHLLTLEPLGSKLILRIENYLDESGNSDLSVDLNKLIKNVKIKDVKETVLSANQWLADHENIEWRTENELDRAHDVRNSVLDITNVKLKANQIRTFVIAYEIEVSN